MKELIPILCWLGGILAAGYITLIALFFVGITAALFNSWRREKLTTRRSRSSGFAPLREENSTKEINMKGRLALVAMLAIAFTITGLTPGCMSGDSDIVNIGDGKLFGQEVDVEIVYTSNLGHEYTVASADGKLFVSAKGDFYEVDQDGFTITAPDGNGGTFTTRIKRVEPVETLLPKPVPPDVPAAESLPQTL